MNITIVPALVVASPRFETKTILNICFLFVGLTQLIIHFLDPALEQLIAYPVLFGVVLTIGLIHGCLDFEIEVQRKPSVTQRQFGIKYLLLMGAVAVVWLVSAQVALLFFLVCTAWHFGETDFSVFRQDAHPVLIMLYGIGITGWLIGGHLADQPTNLQALGFVSAQQAADPFLMANIVGLTRVASIGLIVVAILLSGLYRSPINLLMLGSILLLTWLLPFMPAFTVYFGFWHSLHTIQLIKAEINLTLKALIIRAMPNLLICIGATFVLMAAFALLDLSVEMVLIVFVSALTLPHAATMHGLLLRYRKGTIAA
jgi:Brp/Blh family beta-carotene 15,15'-monooxygenase